MRRLAKRLGSIAFQWSLAGLFALSGCVEEASKGSQDAQSNQSSTGSHAASSATDTLEPDTQSSEPDITSSAPSQTPSSEASSSSSTSGVSTQTNTPELPKDLVVRSYQEDIANQGYASSLMLYPEFDDKRALPVVIVMHGWMGSKEKMRWIGERVAQTGFAAFVITASNAKKLFTQPKDWIENYQAALLSLKAENKRAQSPLQGRLDLEKISVIGHSMGGGGALFFSHEHSNRLKSIVALAPYSRDANKEVHQIQAPTLILTGSKDSVAPPKMGSSFFEALDSSLTKKYQELENVGHNDFEKDGAHHELIASQVLQWFDEHGR